MRRTTLTLACIVALATAGQVQASIIFTFTESGGNVLMNSSGTLETANLVATSFTGWADTGIGNYTSVNTVAMIGGTVVGGTDTAFRFNAGTDFSAWAGGVPFNLTTFGWTPSGTKGFATYVDFGGYQPGIELLGLQMVGSTWTPDQSWSIAGTFASLQMNPGTYTVADQVTGESITYQIGSAATAVPEPSSLAIFAIGGCIAGLGYTGRRKRKVAA